LDVDSTNSKAFGLYRALGFSVEKDIAYYGVDIHFGDRI
jgi:ribosomal protein S18 acetylase RimI-like enzyme